MKVLKAGRSLFMLYNALLGLAAIAIASFTLYLIFTTTQSEISPRDLQWGIIAISFFLLLTALLGLMGSSGYCISRGQQSSAWKCYIALSLIIVAMTGVGFKYGMGWRQNGERRNWRGGMREHFSEKWNKFPDETAMAIQTFGQCCGFSNYMDRVQEPCVRYRQQVGCGKVMLAYYDNQVKFLKPIVLSLLVISLVTLALSAFMWICAVKEDGEAVLEEDEFVRDRQKPVRIFTPSTTAPSTPKGQSYDEWHKTVFR